MEMERLSAVYKAKGDAPDGAAAGVAAGAGTGMAGAGATGAATVNVLVKGCFKDGDSLVNPTSFVSNETELTVKVTSPTVNLAPTL